MEAKEPMGVNDPMSAMDASDATKHLATIRRIMESATRTTVLPGRASAAGGLLALVGCWLTYSQLHGWDFGLLNMAYRSRALIAVRADAIELRDRVICIWAAVAVLAVLVDVIMTVLLAREHGQRAGSRLAKMATYVMGPNIAAAVVLTVALGMQAEWQIVPGVWMLLYGVALWMASVMSVRAPRILGLVFFLAGVLTLFWLSHIALLMVGLTFGLAHIVYGIYLLARFGD